MESVIEKRRINWNLILCLLITISVLALGYFCFQTSIYRLFESVRDVFTSIASLFSDVRVTVNDYSKVKESEYYSLNFMPFTWTEFKAFNARYWRKFTSWTVLKGYLLFLLKFALYALLFLSLFFIVGMLCSMLFGLYFEKIECDYKKESKPLRICKKIWSCTYERARDGILNFISYVRDHSRWLKVWILLFCLYFNVFTILLEFIAYYLYLIVGLFKMNVDALSLYRQSYKLLLDLSTIVRFVPSFLLVISAVIIMEYLARQRGYRTLCHREARNRGMLNERPIVFGYEASMGEGKTLSMTSAGLSFQVELRDRAFEIIVECDFLFPYFKWIKLERDLKLATACHVCYDIPSIRRWMRNKYRKFLKNPCEKTIFGYDFKRYGLFHDDKLKVENIWQVLEDYACAYFIYSVQCSLLITNYSVRSDEILSDLGNFPRWNQDFFKRNAQLRDAYSRRSHIVDYDMFRFGKRVLKDNPNAHALGFGVYLFTEWDKERKNSLQNQELKASEETANQKNDLTDTLLKMIRHAVTIRNRSFVVVIYDLQRAGDWGITGRAIGDVLHIVDKGDMRPVLPFWAPFWLFDAFYQNVFYRFVNVYYRFRHVRSDDVALIHGAHGFVSKVKKMRDNVYNVYNSRRMTLEVKSGNLEGAGVKRYQYISSMKDFAARYGTACLETMFARFAEQNKVGIMDLAEYADEMARDDELSQQHSYLQDEIRRIEEAA